MNFVSILKIIILKYLKRYKLFLIVNVGNYSFIFYITNKNEVTKSMTLIQVNTLQLKLKFAFVVIVTGSMTTM